MYIVTVQLRKVVKLKVETNLFITVRVTEACCLNKVLLNFNLDVFNNISTIIKAVFRVKMNMTTTRNNCAFGNCCRKSIACSNRRSYH